MMGKEVPDWAKRGWEVELDTGEIILEGEREWREVPQKKIARLSLLFDGRRWDLKDKIAYFQKKRASQVPGIPESLVIEQRSIGFYDVNGDKVCYTVDERTGKFNMEVIG